MKISDVEAVYPEYRHVPASWRTHFWQIVVRVQSDAGGAAFGCGGGGRAAVEVVNRHFRELLVGRRIDSVDDIRALWDCLYRASIPYGRRGIAVMALSGVDLALWDLLAKAQRRPVHEMLGGLKRERVRAYASGADIEWYRDLGFTATKTPHRWTGDPAAYDDLADWAAAARNALGPDALLMIDAYMSWDAGVAAAMARRLREYGIYWFEDLLTPDRLEEMRAVRKDIRPVLAAGGEHEFTHYGFGEIARADALDIWQPDATWCGGLTAALRIIALARDAGARVVLHRGGEPWGLPLIAAGLCDDLAEMVLGRRDAGRDILWLDAPVPVDGALTPAPGAGFGVRLNEDIL